jgi:RNA polymerase sigma-70 factor, ECF subfamily
MTQVLDAESAEWVRALSASGQCREQAIGKLYDLLLRIARGECRRRSSQIRLSGPELDDIAHQAAGDAVLAITAKLSHFRGESRFTTWAYKFVILEVSSKMGRHFWRHPTVPWDAEDWDRLVDRFSLDPAEESQNWELVSAIRQAVDDQLNERQRKVFVAIVLNGAPLDTMVAELGVSRNAIYKMMFDARRKLRVALTAAGHLPEKGARS